MELIILIVLLIGFLFIKRSDRARAASYDASRSREAASKSEWLSRVYDEDRFWDVRQLLLDQINGKRDEDVWNDVYQEIKLAYDKMGWEMPHRYCGEEADQLWFSALDGLYLSNILQTVMLANRGMLSEWDATAGIHFNAMPKWAKNSNSPFPRIVRPGDRDWYARQMRSDKKLGHYIIKKLHEHGINDEAYFVPDKNAEIYRFGTEPDTIPGSLVFAPALSEFQRRHVVK